MINSVCLKRKTKHPCNNNNNNNNNDNKNNNNNNNNNNDNNNNNNKCMYKKNVERDMRT